MNVALESPDQPDVVALIAALDAYQDTLYPAEARYALDLNALMAPNVVFAVARDAEGRATGCGAVVITGDEGELKRMFVRETHRGRGVARQVLGLLESSAARRGCRLLLLETGPYQPQALAFYQAQGYERRGPFGTYPEHPLSVFMAKALVAPQARA